MQDGVGWRRRERGVDVVVIVDVVVVEGRRGGGGGAALRLEGDEALLVGYGDVVQPFIADRSRALFLLSAKLSNV